MNPATRRPSIARSRLAARLGELSHETHQAAWVGQPSLQHLARLAAAAVPCADAAQRELGRQLSRFEEQIYGKAKELGATRAEAQCFVRRVTGSDRAARTALLLNGDIDRARAAIDAVVDSLFAGKRTRTGARGRSEARSRSGGPPRATVDGAGISYLRWKAAYGCGDPAIDDQHRQLFDLGNYLIDMSLAPRPSTFRIASAVGRLVAHVARHFADEEAWLAARRYGALKAHRAAHAKLLFRAAQLRDRVDLKSPDVAQLVNFLANDVVEKHLLSADRDYYSLIAQDREASPAGPVPS